MRVVRAALEALLAHELLKLWEEMVDELVQHRSLLLFDLEFKCLEDGLERAQSRSLVPLIALSQALGDLLGGVLGPAAEVQLRDVVDHVLDRADDDLARRVGQVHNIVECAKNLLLQHLPIRLADGVGVGTRLLVHRAQVLLVLHIEWLLAVGQVRLASVAVVTPMLVDNELEVESGLLANITLEVFVHLCAKTATSVERLIDDCFKLTDLIEITRMTTFNLKSRPNENFAGFFKFSLKPSRMCQKALT